jgi:hypothetical protein
VTQLSIDKELWLVVPLFSIGAAVSLGIVTSDLGGLFDLKTVLIGVNGVDFTIARAMSLVALAVAVINRDAGLTDLGALDVWATWVTAGLVLAPPFLPIVEGTLLEAPYSVAAFVIQTLGITIVSYVN